MGRLFLDSANPSDIISAVKSGAVKGVTTNPSIISKEEYTDDYVSFIDEIVKLIPYNFHFSAEVLSQNKETMFKEALLLNKKFISQCNFYVKIPVTYDNLDVIYRCSREGIQVNATACMTALQAKMASDAGASIVSFFYRRALDAGVCIVNEICDYEKLRNKDNPVNIICGSIRCANDVRKCWHLQNDNFNVDVTTSLKVIKEMAFHEKTEESIKKFDEDIKRWHG